MQAESEHGLPERHTSIRVAHVRSFAEVVVRKPTSRHSRPAERQVQLLGFTIHTYCADAAMGATTA